jgi:hypothetical protein
MSRPPRIADEDQPAPRALLGDAQQHIDRVGDYVEKCERVGLPARAAELRDTQRYIRRLVRAISLLTEKDPHP